jgi:membrane-bound lytic murein transglycosylase A
MTFPRISLLASLIALAFNITSCSTAPQSTKPATVETLPTKPTEVIQTLKPVTFAALPGWDKEDLRQAWPAFLSSCEVLVKKSEWKEPCTVARDVDAHSEKAMRLFFESFFRPHQVFNADGSSTGLVTGYYEPVLHGARKRGGAYQTPLYPAPDDLLTVDLSSIYPELKSLRLKGKLTGNRVVPYPSRGELMQSRALAGKELLWVDDPVESFFLQVQGSGRVQLADTRETVRLSYADQNGHPYKSIGRYLVDKGEMTLEQASAQNIKAWVAAHPTRQQEVLNANPSYIFFKEEKLTDPNKGPKGALGVSLTPQRSLAIDPQFVPLGAPVFLSTTFPGKDTPLRRLMMAQDTGSAIKSAVRADLFWGFGADAEAKAGSMKQQGMMWVLLPKIQ